ncbi:MAG: GldG family protein [Gammaproteobacteria bacterium]|nr:GldG family protein [Gammaproteobacteria bacterium]
MSSARGRGAWSLLIAAAALAGLIAANLDPARIDVTTARRNSLSTPSIALLEALPGPLEVTGFLPPAHPGRAAVTWSVERYQRLKPEISLRFLDPGDLPEEMTSGTAGEGELLIERAGQRAVAANASESALSNALARLVRGDQQFLVFTTRHGERSPVREANDDVSIFAAALAARGFKSLELNLAEVAEIPANTSVLVIASPSVDFLEPERDLLEGYLARGGNLLWLLEPGTWAGLRPLGLGLGFEQVPGTVIDPRTVNYGIDNPAVSIVSAYADHPAVAGFELAALLPFAAALHGNAREPWTVTPLFGASEAAWSETAALNGNVGFDDGTDFAGPHALALAFERAGAGGAQRIVAIGDGDFVANTYVGNQGNLDLGIRLVEWLAAGDTLVDVGRPGAGAPPLSLGAVQTGAIGFGFLLVLPGLFLANGILVWRRRRQR